MVVDMALGISAMLIVLHLIRVQRCFVSIMRLKIFGLDLNMDIGIGLDILTCYHMEEGKVPSSMAGSQDALLLTPIGGQVNQAISITMKIMQQRILLAYGMIGLLKPIKFTVAVSTTQL
jgi:hypothetical protein